MVSCRRPTFFHVIFGIKNSHSKWSSNANAVRVMTYSVRGACCQLGRMYIVGRGRVAVSAQHAARVVKHAANQHVAAPQVAGEICILLYKYKSGF